MFQVKGDAIHIKFGGNKKYVMLNREVEKRYKYN